MSWQDMKTYWAWRGTSIPNSKPPTKKTLDYVSVGDHNLCMGVWDNENYTPLHQEDLEFYKKFAVIKKVEKE